VRIPVGHSRPVENYHGTSRSKDRRFSNEDHRDRTAFPQRIIIDELAYAILPFATRVVLRLTRPAFVRDWFAKLLEKTSPGKRYIDEKIVDAIGGIDAGANLGAGSDTRAYRMSALASVPVWEIDQPENMFEVNSTHVPRLLSQIQNRSASTKTL
jgi:O-methyltransferase involved in polyketide biosynthesis